MNEIRMKIWLLCFAIDNKDRLLGVKRLIDVTVTIPCIPVFGMENTLFYFLLSVTNATLPPEQKGCLGMLVHCVL